MATRTVQPASVLANPIVAAYLAAHAADRAVDQSDADPDSLEVRMAEFAKEGADHYAMAWGIHDGEHGALVALLSAQRLQYLIDGYAHTNDRGQKVVTFGIEELYEVRRIKSAMLNLWRLLDPAGLELRPLALEVGLIDDKGNDRD